MTMEPFTPFLGTTVNVPEEQERIPTFLVDQFSQYADVINQKKIGVMTPFENFNGEQWSYKTTTKIRNGYQAIVYIDSFSNGVSTYDVPLSNINEQFVVTQVYGSASKPPSAVGAGDGDYFTFLSEGNSSVTFTMTDTTITVTSNGLTAYTGFIVISYIRDGT